MKNLKEIRDQLKLTQAEMAKRLGTSQPQYQRLERGKRPMSKKWALKIESEFGIPAAQILFTDEDDTSVPARMVKVLGYVQAGEWEETWELSEEDQYDVPIPHDTSLNGYPLYAAETRGPSMNRRYPEGTVLVFTHIIETHEDLIPGKRYIVERERSDGLKEATVKILWFDDQRKPWLLPESTDPRFQEPIALNGDDGDTIRIVGRVRYAVSRE
ncbi:hypothetical protein BFS86_19655 [Shewanella algae]|nr:hypothetical protein BFS86_19655 [Shewanella algae]